jgi:hypothetical protein
MDEAIAVVFEERGGQSFAYNEEGIKQQVKSHTDRGRKAWVFRKAETFLPTPTSGSESESSWGEEYHGLP